MINVYKQLDREQYSRLRKSLLNRKGSARQREFLNATKSDKDFLEFVRREVDTVGSKEIPVFNEKLTEHEYKDPPEDTEDNLYTSWKKIPPEAACRVSFWGEVTLKQIENEGINAYYLAANGGALSGGKERIDKSLSPQGSEKDIDACVRTVLRRMSGLPEARGNRSQYVDCPFGRAWWRSRLSEEVETASKMPRKKIRKLLHLNQTYWERLVTLVVSRNSILGDNKVRYALIWCLAEILEKDPDSKLLSLASLNDFCRSLGVRCAWQELGILDLTDVKRLIHDEILSSTSV